MTRLCGSVCGRHGILTWITIDHEIAISLSNTLQLVLSGKNIDELHQFIPILVLGPFDCLILLEGEDFIQSEDGFPSFLDALDLVRDSIEPLSRNKFLVFSQGRNAERPQATVLSVSNVSYLIQINKIKRSKYQRPTQSSVLLRRPSNLVPHNGKILHIPCEEPYWEVNLPTAQDITK